MSQKARRWVWNNHDRRCHICGKPVSWDELHISHLVPLAQGGRDVDSNRRPAHAACHNELTRTVDLPAIAKDKRIGKVATTDRTTTKMNGNRRSLYKKKLDGSVVHRNGGCLPSPVGVTAGTPAAPDHPLSIKGRRDA